LQRAPEGIWNVPKVVDWGISHALIEYIGSMSQTALEYAALKQCNAFLSDTDPSVHTNLYQLSAVCYELLTGSRPDHLRGNIAPPHEVASDVPPKVGALVETALSHDPDERFYHPLQFRDAMENVLLDTLDVDDGVKQRGVQSHTAILGSSTDTETPESREGSGDNVELSGVATIGVRSP